MAPDPTSPGQLQRAASSEPSTTRPNPFDEDDSSSRKRQRTSLSGSPTQSIDAHAANAAHRALSSANPGGDEARAYRAPEVNMASSAAPRTPEHPPGANQHPHETPSSKVTTINLRNARGASDTASSPNRSSPQPQPVSSRSEADIKESVEDAEIDLVQVPSKEMSTPRSSSPASASPPVEVITIQDDGDEEEVDRIGFGTYNPGISIVGSDQAVPDPTSLFPYNDPEETLSETVQRLSNYISTRKCGLSRHASCHG